MSSELGDGKLKENGLPREASPRRGVPLAMVAASVMLIVLIMGGAIYKLTAASALSPVAVKELSPGTVEKLGSKPAAQQKYVTEIERDRRELYYGRVFLPRARALVVNEPYDYIVKIRDPHSPSAPSASQNDRAPRVLIGGSVSVKLTCVGVSCTPLSTERQNLDSADSASWAWSIVARQTGKAQIYVTVTTYDLDTSNVLAERAPIEQSVSVKGDWAYYLHRTIRATGGLIAFLGAGVIISGLTWLWRYRRRSKDSRNDSLPGSSQTIRPSTAPSRW